MSDETKSAKPPKSKSPKATPTKPDLTGPDTFDLHSLHDLMRAVKPHAGVGMASGAMHLKNVYLKSDGAGKLQAVCKGLGSNFAMTIEISSEIPAFQEFVEPEKISALLGLLKGDRVVVRFSDSKVELFSEGAESFCLRPAEIEGQRGMFAYAPLTNPQNGVKVRAGDLAYVFSKALRFVCKDSQRAGINGLHMALSQRGDFTDAPVITNPLQVTGTPSAALLRLAATDGNRLYVEHIDIQGAVNDNAVEGFIEFFRSGYVILESLPPIAAFLGLLTPNADVWLSARDGSLSLYSPEYDAHLEVSSAPYSFAPYDQVIKPLSKGDVLVTGALGEYTTEANRFTAMCRAHGEEVTRTSFLAIYEDRFEFRHSHQSYGDNPHVFVRVPVKSTGKEPMLYGINRTLWSDSVSALAPESTGPDDKILICFAKLEWRKDPDYPIYCTRGADFNTAFNSAKVPFVIVMPMKVG